VSQSEEKEVVSNTEEEQETVELTEQPTGSEEEVNIEEPTELELLQKQLDEETNRHLRLRADYENFKRRAHLDREAADKYKAQNLLSNLLKPWLMRRETFCSFKAQSNYPEEQVLIH